MEWGWWWKWVRASFTSNAILSLHLYFIFRKNHRMLSPRCFVAFSIFNTDSVLKRFQSNVQMCVWKSNCQLESQYTFMLDSRHSPRTAAASRIKTKFTIISCTECDIFISFRRDCIFLTRTTVNIHLNK